MPFDEYSRVSVTRFEPQDRRAEYDVTNTVCVASVEAVRRAVRDLFEETWPDASFDQVWLAFYDFDRLFRGKMPGFEGCDTVYHDIQHSLDMVLCMARLLAAHNRSVPEQLQLGPEKASVAMIVALFHDSGYLRSENGDPTYNGAEHTLWHIGRSALFLRRYLPHIGLGEHLKTAEELVHFTGYEKDLGDIELDDPGDYLLGHMIGSADLLVQMADRCYLEKCRDRLYLEFVLAGIAISEEDEQLQVYYQSGEDLLRQTPDFYSNIASDRLNNTFGGVYHLLEHLFDGRNPYMECIERNLSYLEQVIETGEWHKLRRKPPCHTVLQDPVAVSNALVNRKLNDLRNSEQPMVLNRKHPPSGADAADTITAD